jgi:hypothetical protein
MFLLFSESSPRSSPACNPIGVLLCPHAPRDLVVSRCAQHWSQMAPDAQSTRKNTHVHKICGAARGNQGVMTVNGLKLDCWFWLGTNTCVNTVSRKAVLHLLQMLTTLYLFVQVEKGYLLVTYKVCAKCTTVRKQLPKTAVLVTTK